MVRILPKDPELWDTDLMNLEILRDKCNKG